MTQPRHRIAHGEEIIERLRRERAARTDWDLPGFGARWNWKEY